jgi:putative DNA primase/helicase
MSTPILATVLSADRIEARGLIARDEFALCRALIAAGFDSRAELVTWWHDGRPSLRIASLAAGARLEVRDNKHGSPSIRRWRAPETAPARGAAARHVSEGGCGPCGGSARMSARDIAARLNLHRAANDWRGDCPACGYASSFVLSETREGKPLWWCASCTDRNALAAVVRCDGPTTSRKPSIATERPSAVQRRAWACDLWEHALPARGTVVDAYLRSRGLGSVTTPELRWLPTHRHKPTGALWPVMIAAVRDAAGALRAVHRTYLARDGSAKAQLGEPRMTLGNPKGCAVHLSPADAAMVVAEGIETAIAAGLLFDLPAWACVSAGGLEAVSLPAVVRSVLIAADHDVRGQGQRAAQALAQRLLAEGRRVRIATPDRPGDDFNDVLLRERTNA